MFAHDVLVLVCVVNSSCGIVTLDSMKGKIMTVNNVFLSSITIVMSVDNDGKGENESFDFILGV